MGQRFWCLTVVADFVKASLEAMLHHICNACVVSVRYLQGFELRLSLFNPVIESCGEASHKEIVLDLVFEMWDFLYAPHFTEARAWCRGKAEIAKFEHNGVVVRAHTVIQDGHFGYVREEALGHHYIVDGCLRARAVGVLNCPGSRASAGRCAIQDVDIEAFCVGK